MRGGGTVLADVIEAFMSHVKARLGTQFDEEGARKHLTESLSEPETTGIAARVSEERAQKGLINEAPEPGEGIAPKDSVAHGKELVDNGVDPQFVLDQFNKTKRFNDEDIAVLRYHEQTLAKAATDAARQHGIDSPEYESAKKDDTEWLKAIKQVQTAWARGGHAMQGEVEVDTGTFHGLQHEFTKDTGKEFTPKQASDAEKIADGVSKADKAATDAKDTAIKAVSKDIDPHDAERRALDAASKTVREAAARAAAAETKARVAEAGEKAKATEEQIAAAKALKAAHDVQKDAAAKLAKAENDARVKAAQSHENLEEERAKKALAAAAARVREAAARAAAAETKARVAEAADEKKAAEQERKAAQKKLDAEIKARRAAAIKAADAANKARILRADTVKAVHTKALEYIQKGMDDYDDIVNKVATDLGMEVGDVRKTLAKNPVTKRLTDEAYRKQQIARRIKVQANIWVKAQSVPGLLKIWPAIRQELFNQKVLGHVSVALGTHTPALLFLPKEWGLLIKNYRRMWGYALDTATHEAAMQDLTRRPNWGVARLAGVENDPHEFEEYNLKGLVERLFPKLAHAGNRAYDVLKVMRQDLFDKQWNVLSKSEQTPEMAAAMARDINHLTGITKDKTPFKAFGVDAGKAMFAPPASGFTRCFLVRRSFHCGSYGIQDAH